MSAKQYAALLRGAAHQYHIGEMTYEAHSAFNRSLWSEIESRPRTKSRVLSLLRNPS